MKNGTKLLCIAALCTSLSACENPDDNRLLLGVAAVAIIASAVSANSCTPGRPVVFAGGGTGWAVGNC